VSEWHYEKSKHSAFWGVFIEGEDDMPFARTLTEGAAKQICEEHNQLALLQAQLREAHAEIDNLKKYLDATAAQANSAEQSEREAQERVALLEQLAAYADAEIVAAYNEILGATSYGAGLARLSRLMGALREEYYKFTEPAVPDTDEDDLPIA
jgi:chromosome segregation ATPase